MLLGAFPHAHVERRSVNTLRDFKNYAIITNTLLRKAAEYGHVHPLHIDSLSSRFAHSIENANSREDIYRLMREMARKYCLLVKNHSLQGYSPLVRDILVRISSDLTADLSLKTQAAYLHVSASYLSAVFKKETGFTLTEYVNRKRVEYGIFLLNSTSLQIQTIAQHCGIPDLNYFSKTFKKYMGFTPTEYRSQIMPPVLPVPQNPRRRQARTRRICRKCALLPPGRMYYKAAAKDSHLRGLPARASYIKAAAGDLHPAAAASFQRFAPYFFFSSSSLSSMSHTPSIYMTPKARS